MAIREVTGGYDRQQHDTTIAATGINGYNGGSIAGTQAQLNYPPAAVDGQGNVYIVHDWNGLVRQVGTSGTISTFPSGRLGCVGLWRRHWTNRANRANPGPLVRAASVWTPVAAPTVARFCGPILRRGRDDRTRKRAEGWPRQARIRWWRWNRCPIGPIGPIIPA